MQVQSLALISSLGSGIAMSCDVGRRCSLDPLLPWLWCRPAGVAPIQPLAWEPPYAVDADLKRQRTKKKKNVYTSIPESLCHTPETNTTL